MYGELGVDFFKQKDEKIYNAFDDKKQKVMINPGMPYVSTSQAEVFALRYKKGIKQKFKNQNQFIKFVD